MGCNYCPFLPAVAGLAIVALHAVTLVHADIYSASELDIGGFGEFEGPKLC